MIPCIYFLDRLDYFVRKLYNFSMISLFLCPFIFFCIPIYNNIKKILTVLTFNNTDIGTFIIG